MGGDYSRRSFDAKKHFSQVLMQQGRVQLDSDWNTNSTINDRQKRTTTLDTIGRCGVPADLPDSFKIGVDSTNNLTIGVGRIYIDGQLVENHGNPPESFDPALSENRGTSAIRFTEQPYLPATEPLALGLGVHLAYLEVWQREVTYVEDPDILEPALASVDTATRLQTVWQVKTFPWDIDWTCETSDEDIEEWFEFIQPSAGLLSTSILNEPNSEGPCWLPGASGYRGPENQCYRVEIHEVLENGNATCKWSRNSGPHKTIVFNINGTTLTVERIKLDVITGFKPGDFVEITDDWREFSGLPGVMRTVQAVNEGEQTISLSSPLDPNMFPVDPQGNPDPKRHTRILRWDHTGSEVIPIPSDGTPIELEFGIQCTIEKVGDGVLRPLDHWLFAARTADGSVEELVQAPPHGIHRHFCRLAIIRVQSGENENGPPVLTVLSDCRKFFSPLTESSQIPTDFSPKPGIHVERIVFGQSSPLRIANDSVIPANHLQDGLEFLCDHPIDPVSINPATCFVTVDLPYPLTQADRELWTLGDQNIILAYTPLILGAIVGASHDASQNKITWNPLPQTIKQLGNSLFQQLQTFEIESILARLVLKGNFIWGLNDPDLHLDGNVLGKLRSTIPNSPATDLILPSGNGIPGGDFEMWFWIVPPEQ